MMERDELAGSLHRAYTHASGQNLYPFEHLSFENQAFWLRVALRGPDLLERLEGRAIPDVTAEVVRLGYGEARADADAALAGAARRCFEAVTRHLAALLDTQDDDEPVDVAALEASWGPWAAQKNPQPEGALRAS